MPCPRHDINDCGCPGYPNLVGVLRDCGNNCYEHRHMNRCFRCRAADEIESANRRNRRLIEVICDLQDRLEDSVDQIAVIIPRATAEQIVETDRIFPALEQLRHAINKAVNNFGTFE